MRFTSPADERVRWIAGAYFIADRPVHLDRQHGRHRQRRRPRVNRDAAAAGFNPQFTFLADSQDNFAWAVFGDAELRAHRPVRARRRAALRRGQAREHDRDAARHSCPIRSDRRSTGQVRTETWSELQPKVTLRYKPNDDVTLYGGCSRGFRSGGFNQTGVGAVASTASPASTTCSTRRSPTRSRSASRRSSWTAALSTSAERLLHRGRRALLLRVRPRTPARRTSATSTSVDYKGFELELNAQRHRQLRAVSARYGYTDSEITGHRTRPDRTSATRRRWSPSTRVNLGAQ